MFRAFAVIAAFALLVYALADFASSDERDRGGIPRWLWAVLIIVLPYFGPLSWIVFSKSRRSQAANASTGTAAGRPGGRLAPRARRRPGAPLAPDDDPEFLWRLAQEQRNQARSADAAGTAGAAGAAGGAGAGTSAEELDGMGAADDLPGDTLPPKPSDEDQGPQPTR